jgi:hypothetical protein
MWMGGVPPLGYRVQDRKLVIIDSEAEIVRSNFRRYAELGSMRLLKAELEAQGSKSKSWTSAAGRVIGGKPFSRGALYLMLRNRIYRGEIVHQGQSHPGEHPPIIDQRLAKWEGVSPSYFTRLVRLSYLAPDITEAILDGRQPRDLTADKLLVHSRLLLGWHEQRTVLGFA